MPVRSFSTNGLPQDTSTNSMPVSIRAAEGGSATGTFSSVSNHRRKKSSTAAKRERDVFFGIFLSIVVSQNWSSLKDRDSPSILLLFTAYSTSNSANSRSFSADAR